MGDQANYTVDEIADRASRQLSRAEIAISGMIVIGVFGFLSDQLVMLIGRRLLTWSPSHR